MGMGASQMKTRPGSPILGCNRESVLVLDIGKNLDDTNLAGVHGEPKMPEGAFSRKGNRQPQQVIPEKE